MPAFWACNIIHTRCQPHCSISSHRSTVVLDYRKRSPKLSFINIIAELCGTNSEFVMQLGLRSLSSLDDNFILHV
jgi:hypothetical protein